VVSPHNTIFPLMEWVQTLRSPLPFLATSLQFNASEIVRNPCIAQVSRLQSATYAAPWLGSRRETQNSVLMICSAATERAMPLPGTPFFTLSLEFFASVSYTFIAIRVFLIRVPGKIQVAKCVNKHMDEQEKKEKYGF
jgi:hypothetical protein